MFSGTKSFFNPNAIRMEPILDKGDLRAPNELKQQAPSYRDGNVS